MPPRGESPRAISCGSGTTAAELTLAGQLSDRLRPGVGADPLGLVGREANVNALTNDTLTDWGGGVAYSDTLVEAAKAD